MRRLANYEVLAVVFPLHCDDQLLKTAVSRSTHASHYLLPLIGIGLSQQELPRFRAFEQELGFLASH